VVIITLASAAAPREQCTLVTFSGGAADIAATWNAAHDGTATVTGMTHSRAAGSLRCSSSPTPAGCYCGSRYERARPQLTSRIT